MKRLTKIKSWRNSAIFSPILRSCLVSRCDEMDSEFFENRSAGVSGHISSNGSAERLARRSSQLEDTKQVLRKFLKKKIDSSLSIIAFLSFILILSLQNQAFAAKTKIEKAPKWSYFGENGPNNWGNLGGDLDEKFKFCKIGKNQSPINIPAKLFATHDLEFFCHESEIKKTKENYAARLNFDRENSLIRAKKSYNLHYLTCHHPSEHLVADHQHSLEMELFFKSEDEQWLAVSIFAEFGKENGDNKDFEPLILAFENAQDQTEIEKQRAWRANDLILESSDLFDFDDLQPSKAEEKSILGQKLDLAKIFKFDDLKNETAFFYEGSFTTPPCFEGVKRYIFKNPIYLSKTQLNRLIKAAIYQTPNARPVQKFNPKRF